MRVLIVEDEPRLAARLSAALAAAGFIVDTAGTGSEAAFLGSTEPFDAIVLDVGLPDIDGLAILAQWRASGRKTPVLILTARGRWHEKLAGFNAGADDYLTKPFETEEVIVRLRALIRRSAGHAAPVLTCGPLKLDVNAARFEIKGEPLVLTAQEHRILSFFIHHPGRIISRTELAEHVYDRHFDRDSNVLDVLIGRIRRKLGIDMITTVRSQGFMLSDTASRADAP
jgi:two-component system, OmpR family, response regulator